MDEMKHLIEQLAERRVDRRQFLRRAIALGLSLPAASAILAACGPATPSPTPAPAKPAATVPAPAAQPAATTAPTAAAKPVEVGDRLVIAVPQWATETPLGWRSSLSEGPLWNLVFDPPILRDPATFQMRPGLATEWTPSDGSRTWTFKLRPGVMFHESHGEFTADDAKFNIEQNLKPDAQGGSAPFFRSLLDKVEAPDKYTLVVRLKQPSWQTPAEFAVVSGVFNVISKRYVEQVGEEKAALHPIGTGPYRHVEGRQGDYHRFEAVPNHWRVGTPAFREIVVRRVPDPAARLAGLRSGEIDIGQVTGDFLDQARKAGLRIVEMKGVAPYWFVLTGQSTPDYEDYCPTCPWVGDAKDAASQERARKVRLALNLAVNKQAIIDGLWRGGGATTPFNYWYFPTQAGFDQEWKIPPYDPSRARQLLAEAGYADGFEVRVNPAVTPFSPDAPEVAEAVAMDWEKVGLKVKRVPEDVSSFLPKVRARKTKQSFFVYAGPISDEPGVLWPRVVHSKGVFNLLAEGPFDQDVNAIVAEMDPARRAQLTHDLGDRLYRGYYGVMLGVKSSTWAVSKKVGSWSPIGYPIENNYASITWSGQ